MRPGPSETTGVGWPWYEVLGATGTIIGISVVIKVTPSVTLEKYPSTLDAMAVKVEAAPESALATISGGGTTVRGADTAD